MEKYVPLADWYMTKVLNRVTRTLAGDHLGDLVESELEDLEIDNDFELQRNQVENVSSQNTDDFTPRSEESRGSKQNTKALYNNSERINYRELGRSPPLTTDRYGEMTQQVEKTADQKKQDFIDKIRKKMSHRILKIMI